LAYLRKRRMETNALPEYDMSDNHKQRLNKSKQNKALQPVVKSGTIKLSRYM
jgi:hypothetical protein